MHKYLLKYLTLIHLFWNFNFNKCKCKFFVCLCRFQTKTTKPILINFSIKILLTKEKPIGYFLTQKYNLKGK